MTLRTITYDPAQYKLAPLEQTAEMLHAWDAADDNEDDNVSMRNAYHAMLAAVPDTLPGVIEHSGDPVAMVTDGTTFGPGLAFLANGKDFPKRGALLYTHAAPAQPVERSSAADERMRHDYPILQQFHAKHALGGKAAPSCLCCGQQTHPITRPISVTHMELPAVVVCQPCKDASATLAQPVERQELSDEDIGREWIRVMGIANAERRMLAVARAIIAADRGQA